MDVIWSILLQIIWWFVGAAWWLLSQLFWMMLWLALPLLVAAFIAFRMAGHVFGKPAVEAWAKRQATRLGAGTWRRIHRALFAMLMLPPRVLLWLIVYSLWHSVLSLLWTPRWKPWKRAWGKRWLPRAAAR